MAIPPALVFPCSSGDHSEGSHSSCASITEDGLYHYFAWQHLELSTTLHLNLKKSLEFIFTLSYKSNHKKPEQDNLDKHYAKMLLFNRVTSNSSSSILIQEITVAGIFHLQIIAATFYST